MNGERGTTDGARGGRECPPAQQPRLSLPPGMPPAVPGAGRPLLPRPGVPAPRLAWAGRPPRTDGPTAGARDGGAGHGDGAHRGLPPAGRVLAVIARPGQESADLGAVLAAYHLGGAQLSVLCLTHGEASEMNSTCERLEAVRPWELQVAAGMLGVSSVTVADYPDGRLAYVPAGLLTEHILRAIHRGGADLVLVTDPAAAADGDTAAVARAACLAARHAGLAVLARTLPGPGLRWRAALGPDARAVRERQRCAIDAHASQRAGGPPETARGPRDAWELVRWLVPPAVSPAWRTAGAAAGAHP